MIHPTCENVLSCNEALRKVTEVMLPQHTSSPGQENAPTDSGPHESGGDQPPEPRRRRLEISISTVTVFGSTAAYLLDNPALSVVTLVLGGVAYGIALGR
jgi:hypothetical protein